MGSSVSSIDCASLNVSSGSCLCSPNLEKSAVKYEQLACTGMNDTKQIFVEDLESYRASDADVNGSSDEGVSETMHISNRLELLSVNDPSVEKDTVCNVEAISLEMDALVGLNKHASILVSELSHLYLVDSDAEDGSPSVVDNEKSDEVETLAVAELLPTTDLKPVSAMKGSRAQQGILLNTKLCVKWSPEVYDPPVTSSSHTVMGRQRRHHHHHSNKAKRDYHKQPCSKGKSSKSSVSERKHVTTHRRSSTNPTDPRFPRSETYRYNEEHHDRLANSCGESKKVEPVADLPVRSSDQIIEYGGGCYMKSLAPVQILPVAEAS